MAGLALIPMVLSAVGGVVSAMGQAQAANAQADAKDAEAQAQLRKGLQENAIKQREAATEERKMKKVMSDQRAGFASSGGGVDTGSALGVADATARRGIFNRDATLWEGAEAQAGRQTQANILGMEADSYRQSAKTTMMSGVISGVSGVLSGGAKGVSGSGGGSGNYYYG